MFTLVAACIALLDKLYLDSPSEYFPVNASNNNSIVSFPYIHMC